MIRYVTKPPSYSLTPEFKNGVFWTKHFLHLFNYVQLITFKTKIISNCPQIIDSYKLQHKYQLFHSKSYYINNNFSLTIRTLVVLSNRCARAGFIN